MPIVFPSLFSLRKTTLPLAAVALSLVLVTKPAQAQQDDPTKSTTAGQNVEHPDQSADNVKPPLFLTFTKIRPAGAVGPSPDATFYCSIGAPSVTTNATYHTVNWVASASCSTSVGLYGTTVLYQTGNLAIAGYGTQINTTSTQASSSGGYTGLLVGDYAVNFNIDITPPPGYTTTVSGGCSFINGGPNVQCTVETPFGGD